MLDEFGGVFYDACFPLFKPDEHKEADTQQHSEWEKDRVMREYPLKYPAHELVFDQFIYSDKPDFEIDHKPALGFILFRAYKAEDTINKFS